MILNSARRMGVGAWCALLFLMVVMASGPARAGRAESEAYLNAAKAAIEKNDVPGAINSLNSAIAADPANDRPYAAMAEVYEQLHSYDIAAEKIQKAAQLNPGYAPYWVDLGRYEKLQKHYDKAIEALNRAANLDKKSAEIPYQLAMVYYDKNDLDDAEKAINKAVEADDSNFNYKLWRARIRYHVGKGDAAESELSSIVTRLKATKGQVYDDASKLLTTISQEKRKKLIQKYALIGVPAAVLVVAAVVLIPMLRRGRRGGGGGGGGARMDLTGDATTFEDISAMALRRLCSMTQMSHGVMFVTTIDGDQMDPKASVVLDPDELKPVGVDVNELPRWIERNDGKPFLFNVEKKEGVFIKAFPEARESMEPLEMRIGVPFIFQEKLLGMAFLGMEKSKDILKLKKLYERSQTDIYRVAVEVASALFRLYENELAYVDVVTKFRSRKHVEENLPRELVAAEDSGRKGVVLIFEFDQYRTFEEQYGESQADSILKQIAGEVKLVFPPDEALLARFEGGRFFAFQPVHTLEQAGTVGMKVHERIGATRISRNLQQPTASVGVAVFPDHGRKADDLIWAAERVMMGIYAAGGNNIGYVEGGAAAAGPQVIEAPPAAAPGFPRGAGSREDAPATAPPGSLSTPRTASPAAAPEGKPPPFVPGRPTVAPAAAPAAEAAPEPAAPPAAGAPRLVAPGRVPAWMKQETPAPEAPAPPTVRRAAGPEGPAAPPPRFPGPPPAAAPPPFPAAPAASAAPPFPAAAPFPSVPGAPTIPNLGTSGLPPVGRLPGFGDEAPPEQQVQRPAAPPPTGPRLPGFGPETEAPDQAPRPLGPPPTGPRLPGFGLDTTEMEPSARPGGPPSPIQGGIPGFSGIPTPGVAPPEPVPSPVLLPPTTGAPPPWLKAKEPAEMPPTESEAEARPRGGMMSRPSAPGRGGLFGRRSTETEGQEDAPANPMPAPLRAGPPPPVGGPAVGGGPRRPAAPAAAGGLLDASKDALTGFLLSERLEEAIARAVDKAYDAQEPCSIVYFQLDRHDDIVATAGEGRFNDIVKEITSLVNDFLKEGTDVPARWGEDGFAIILPRTSSRIACNLAEQLRFTIGNLSFPGVDGNTTLSLGIAAYPEQAHSPQELLRFAQEASQTSQSEGGNKFHVYEG